MADSRIAAWVMSWRLLDAAQKSLDKDWDHPQVGDWHDRLVDRAEIYARLASAPEDVGEGAGEFLDHAGAAQRESRDHIKKALQEYKNARS